MINKTLGSDRKYFAFISYKREDEKWAKWLQHKLEHYRLPVNVRKENPSFPQTIRPVFKDTSELAAGVLADEIQEALENSNHLIVVCSPRAAQSKWVGNEVKTFIDMGRTDKIIPFIIGGTPFSDNPEDECFPSILLNLPKEQELLGVNINEMGRDAAVVKVVSRMFGLKFDILWQRYEREKKKRRAWIGTALIAFFSSILCVSGYILQKNIEISDAYKFISNQNLMLDAKNDSIALAYKTILEANDSITKQKMLLQRAYDDLERSKAELAKSNADLNERNKQLKETNNSLLLSNIKTLSYLADLNRESGLLNESYTNLLEIDSIIRMNDLSLAVLPQEYENSLRTYYQFWARPGFSQITHKLSKEHSSQGGWFDDDNTIFLDYTFDSRTQMPIKKSWDYMNNLVSASPEGTSLSPSYVKWLKNSGIYHDGKILVHKDNYLYAVDLYTTQTVGKRIPFEGDQNQFQYGTLYKFCPKGTEVVIVRGKELFKGDYSNGEIVKLHDFPSGVSSFAYNPKNTDVIAVTSSDSMVWVYNVSRRMVLRSKKMLYNPNGVSFHPDGKRILVYGQDVKLLSPNLTIADSISAKDLRLDFTLSISMAIFNEEGNRLFLDDGSVHSIWQLNAPHYDYTMISKDGRYSVRKNRKKYILWDNVLNQRKGSWEILQDNNGVECFSEDGHFLVFHEFLVNNDRHWNYKVLSVEDGKVRDVVSENKSFDKILLTKDGSNLIAFDVFRNIIYSYSLNAVRTKEIPFDNFVYNPIHNTFFVSDSKELVELSPDLDVKQRISIANTSNSLFTVPVYIEDLCISPKGTHIYYSTNRGDVYKVNLNSKEIEIVLSCSYPVTELSIDDSERFMITHHHQLSMNLFGNGDSNTEIWDLRNKKCVENLSELKLSHASWLKGNNRLIDTGSHLIRFERLNDLQSWIRKKK